MILAFTQGEGQEPLLSQLKEKPDRRLPFVTLSPLMQKYYFTYLSSLLSLLVSSQTLGKEAFEMNERVNSVYQAIVRIEVVSERGSNGRMQKSGSTGSGVIIDKSGLVVTNHHVAGKATRLTCRLYDGEEVGADLLGADALTDLAVLKLRLNDRPENPPYRSLFLETRVRSKWEILVLPWGVRLDYPNR